MKNLFFLFVLSFTIEINAQTSVIRLEKMTVPDCNCSFYMPKGTPTFEKNYSQDSAMVFTSEFKTEDDFTFGAIAVKFKNNIGNDKTANEELLMAYMDYLKDQFVILSAAGYGSGHTLEKYPNAIGVIDYWEDLDDFQYAVKGWIDGDKLAILFIFGKKEYPVFNIQQMFLDGFRFD